MLTVLIEDHPYPCCQDLCVWMLSFQRIINLWEPESWVIEIRSWKQIPRRHAIPNSFLSHSPRFLTLQPCEKLSQTHNSVTMGVPSCTILSPWVDMLVHLWLLRPNEVSSKSMNQSTSFLSCFCQGSLVKTMKKM